MVGNERSKTLTTQCSMCVSTNTSIQIPSKYGGHRKLPRAAEIYQSFKEHVQTWHGVDSRVGFLI